MIILTFVLNAGIYAYFESSKAPVIEMSQELNADFKS